MRKFNFICCPFFSLCWFCFLHLWSNFKKPRLHDFRKCHKKTIVKMYQSWGKVSKQICFFFFFLMRFCVVVRVCFNVFLTLICQGRGAFKADRIICSPIQKLTPLFLSFSTSLCVFFNSKCCTNLQMPPP